MSIISFFNGPRITLSLLAKKKDELKKLLDDISSLQSSTTESSYSFDQGQIMEKLYALFSEVRRIISLEHKEGEELVHFFRENREEFYFLEDQGF